jgi:integrase
MASLYKRPGSPFWWVRYRDPKTGKIKRESTGERHGTVLAHRRAKLVESNRTAAENASPPAGADSRWENWVVPYLHARHGHTPPTLRVYLRQWATISVFFDSRGLAGPQQVTRQDCQGFLGWRSGQGDLRANSSRPVLHNTAVNEFRLLGKLLNEAFRRGWILSNPSSHMGVSKMPPREKGEFTDEQIAFVRDRIRQRIESAKYSSPDERGAYDPKIAEFLRVSWEIGLAQGVRLAETCFPLSAIDWERGILRLRVKGNRINCPPLNPTLRPLLEELRARGQSHTYERVHSDSVSWWHFFKDIRQKRPDFANLSFHSLRVTAISRMERAGVPEAVVMKIVGHASTTVHRIYRRIVPSEVSSAWAALPGGGKPPASSSPDAPASTSAPPPRSSNDRPKT